MLTMNSVLTAANIRLQLAQEDKTTLSETSNTSLAAVHDDITASMFINQGIELEELRFVVLSSLLRLIDADWTCDLGVCMRSISRRLVHIRPISSAQRCSNARTGFRGSSMPGSPFRPFICQVWRHIAVPTT